MGMNTRLLPLMAILAATWILIFLGALIIFGLIVPMPNLFPGRTGLVFAATLKVALSAILVAIWLGIMLKLRDIFVNRKLLRGGA